MKLIIFAINLFLMTLSGFGQAEPSPPDPAPENPLFCHFDRPWFPQWESGLEVSGPGMGYRLEGEPIDLIIYGYGLDPGEEIRLENRDSIGRLVSSGSIYTDRTGKFFLRINTELPDEFRADKFYNVYLIRENGYTVKAGSFYVAEPPPDDYHYVSWGHLTYGFACDKAGKPYLLSWLSYDNGPNMLDNYQNDRGREFQGDLIDGYPEQGTDWRWNTVVPCQGAGDYGRELPVVSSSQIEPDYIYAKTKPLDYEPNRPEMNGPYRQKVLENRWPETGWNLETEYKMSCNDVTLTNRFWHTDVMSHRVHQIRTAQVFLNPVFFQNPPLNNNKRVDSSYLRATVDDIRVEAYSHALGIKITFRANVDQFNSYYFQRYWNYQDFYGLAEPGTVQVWECLNVAEINKFILRNQVVSGWGRLTITEADRLGLGFDMEKFREYLKMIFEQHNYIWK